MFLGLSVYYVPPPIEWKLHKVKAFADLFISVALNLAYGTWHTKVQ